MPYFKILKQSSKSRARLTELLTPHGKIHGPFFMPIATRGAVKNISVDELNGLGCEILLSNTYHLFLRPGVYLMKKYGGLHRFMNWSRPILTDSGGYQIFSLRRHRVITKDGVTFRDPMNGNKYFFSPEDVVKIQHDIGSDIMMVLDECPPYPCSKEYARASMELTSRWAKRAQEEMQRMRKKHKAKKTLVFGIVQGSVFEDLRRRSAKEIVDIGFDGYAIGGVAVGEPREEIKKVIECVEPLLPKNKPRYLMGLGKPEELVYAVQHGMDMFDCVIPTREARHKRLYLWKKKAPFSFHKLKGGFPAGDSTLFYETIHIYNAKYANDLSPINSTNLKHYSKAYLHHLFRTGDPLALRLASLNNLEFYLTLMKKIRKEIVSGRL